jgi:ABC-type glutathione transport system ATPase component
MPSADDAPRVLSIRALTKTYVREKLLSHERVAVEALRGVDLTLPAGNTLAIAGPSGSGKSTLARCIAGLEDPTSGEISFLGQDLRIRAVAHRHVQLVFQDPGASLNPRFSVGEALYEPLAVQFERRNGFSVADRLQLVGLAPNLSNRLTSQLSGGQKVRLALARAITALEVHGHGGILILDESLGSLDLSVRAQIVNLLIDLQASRPLTYVLITHDLTLAAQMADEVVTMSDGRIVSRNTRRAYQG